MAGLRNQTFDDRDTTSLVYRGFWFQQGVWNASNTGETGTLTSSSDLNANVTFIFPVPAVAFYYYAIPRANGGAYGVCVDCDPNGRIFTTIDAVNRSDDGHNPPVLLYSQKFQTPGVHEIILRNQPDTRFANNNSQITIDRFEIEVIDPNIPPPATPTSSLIPTFTAALGKESQEAKVAPVGAIVGAIVGGLAILVLILVGWWCLWKSRRRRMREAARKGGPGILTDGESLPPVSLPDTQGKSNEKRRSRKPQRHEANPSFGSRPDWMSSTGPSTITTMASVPRLPRRETDAGPAREEDADELETLPPEYEQVFRQGRRSVVNATRSTRRLPQVTTVGKS